jgi:hypothetical protein
MRLRFKYEALNLSKLKLNRIHLIMESGFNAVINGLLNLV